MIRFLGLITTNTGNPSLWMFVGFNFFERSIIEPIFNFFYVIIITFGSGEDIESIIELHVEGEMAIEASFQALENQCLQATCQTD